jgi:hypothetical protein
VRSLPGSSIADAVRTLEPANLTPVFENACAPGTLCLLGGRFQVDVTWQTGSGAGVVNGVGTPTALSDQSGTFWFFDAANTELVVKVLDGRPLNGKFWFFYGALSDVVYQIRVTDTATGVFVSAHARGVAMLSQQALLFPHMSVAANVAYAPRCKGMSRKKARAAVEARETLLLGARPERGIRLVRGRDEMRGIRRIRRRPRASRDEVRTPGGVPHPVQLPAVALGRRSRERIPRRLPHGLRIPRHARALDRLSERKRNARQGRGDAGNENARRRQRRLVDRPPACERRVVRRHPFP